MKHIQYRPEKCDKHTRTPQTYHNINLKTPLANPIVKWQENRRWGCLDLGLRLRIRVRVGARVRARVTAFCVARFAVFLVFHVFACV